ncbi:hypothetical protein BCON_0145g00050 [Botryotinia convoluta]|uniref:DNA (cytosine-5-)-methyltransferase n=1 Tax=Botryotinia convoluta TaxID=54673 RepID=A0A4Z1I5K1_9HELO|nr:hypothetical protein BCON_0145g00050 [Botryotinia convoluta]
MDQAMFIDDDVAVVMIEDDDRDEVVILERVPSMSPAHFFDADIRNRASSPNTREHLIRSTVRSQFDNPPAPDHSANFPFIDLTTPVVFSTTKPKESNSPGDRVCRVSTSLPGFIFQDEGYESSRPWNIAAEVRTDQETSQDRICLSKRPGTKEGSFSPCNEMVANFRNTSHTHSMPERRSSNASLISISDEGDGDEEKTSTAQDMTSHTGDNAVIIEDSDDFEFKLESQLLEKPEFEFLRSVSVSEKSKPQPKLKAVPLRNPPIASPYFECEMCLHGKLILRAAKTVELEDGDFIYIKHIVKYVKPEDSHDFSLDETQNSSITIRGFRLQRCKYLNGMLEKKMNEVCLCYEIDSDDPRAPEEQSIVEVPLSSVKTLRSLRWTNHNYPKYRNLNRDATWTDEDTYIKGGLTVRWKYTCKYASASAREKNIYAERTLERITEEWLTSVRQSTQSYLASNTQLRTEWRGETVPGGTYIPECYDVDGEETAAEFQQPQNPAVVEDTESRPETFIIVDEDDDDDDNASSPARSQQYEAGVIQTKRKSDFSSSSDRDSDEEDNKPAKRARQVPEDDIEQIRQRLGRVKLAFNGKEYVKQSYNIGTLSETVLKSEPKSKLISTQQIRDTSRPAGGLRSIRGFRPRLRGRLTLPRNSALKSRAPYPEASVSLPTSPAPSPNVPPQIEISSSELASPPSSGVIDLSPPQSRSSSLVPAHSSRTPSLKEPLVLAPGQTFTYGDAFCGAGGTTRGAVMAGLRVKWGFDFDQHACTTWRLNFPGATCYEMSSERFVSLATPSPCPSDIPNDVKVDILHLSPPCQYFSPAHTVEGKNDEMNTASLFAVAAVIKVAKPRLWVFVEVGHRAFGSMGKFLLFSTLGEPNLLTNYLGTSAKTIPFDYYRVMPLSPGEPLPPMPPPTHSPPPSSPSPPSPLHKPRPFKTVSQTLREIPKSAANHSPHLLPEKDLKPYNPHAILPRTMTTSGGDNWHPSGKRGFTDREFACLQGFPLEHKFGQNGIKRQIGNAVPPVVAKVLFEGIRRFMEGTDGVVRDEGDGYGDKNGDGDGEVEVDDKMDICGDIDMDGVRIEDSDDRVEIVDLVDEAEDTDSETKARSLLSEESDDEIEIVGVAEVGKHIVID